MREKQKEITFVLQETFNGNVLMQRIENEVNRQT